MLPFIEKMPFKELFESFKEAGHEVVFLPKCSPDLNDIEPDFRVFKINIVYALISAQPDEII